jgi:hypothetical protein
MMVMVLALVVRRNWLGNGSRLVVGNYWTNLKNVLPCLVPILCMSIQNLQREKYTWHFHLYSCTTMMTRTISMIRIVSKCYSIYPAIDSNLYHPIFPKSKSLLLYHHHQSQEEECCDAAAKSASTSRLQETTNC